MSVIEKTSFAISIPKAELCIKGYNSFLILLCSSFHTTDAAADTLRAKQKTRSAAWEVRSSVMEETQEGHCMVVMRGLCVRMHLCACVLRIIALLPVVIA